MEEAVFHIPRISCGHCTMAIERELKDLTGVTRAVGDAQAKSVTVSWQPPATREKILAMLKEINYPAAE